MPPVESPADRLAMLADFGVACRLTLSSAQQVTLTAIVETPTVDVGDVASEVSFLEYDQTARVRTEDVPGLAVEDVFEVLDGPYSGTFQVLRHEREGDGAFTRLGLGT